MTKSQGEDCKSVFMISIFFGNLPEIAGCPVKTVNDYDEDVF